MLWTTYSPVRMTIPVRLQLFDACWTSAVAATVGKQVASGIVIVSDGESSRISYAASVKGRYMGSPETDHAGLLLA